ncbi:anthranilate phosphoribosyltransferase [Kibdelosporangium phytohabitans]|uniref:Glycosyl transferase family 3 domain-containing protein n=1 Tax=Kibdelosporangium phytohabitans TaxID=860235 RepID=A0A0N7F3Q0_9PSEU|nr:hypothetical protein [Kibdelosporangium phytohabitans]ALG09247.1 hypothetical protein AOZ06_22120 [Kibdelosporangium phytohabitans]MBE1469513.1 anthranilate phosphoribosyltransferase [Kibdelosporangium phytohabitans]
MDDDLLTALVSRQRPVEHESWRTFFNRLVSRKLRRGEAAAVLTSLSTAMPGEQTLVSMMDCLDERRPAPEIHFPGTVNIVGTGGGPKTFNVSTAAAMVAAAMGARVVKTGSKGFTSRYGSLDLLGRLGVPLTKSYQETAESLERFGVAFAGNFVYPAEIAMLAKEILPLELRAVGRFVNSIGPFLGSMPVSAQLTGVSDPAVLPSLRSLARRLPGRRVWLCHNELGVDELIGFVPNVIIRADGEQTLAAGSTGSLTDLTPAVGDPVEQFLGVLAGQVPETALATVCLNAAALSVLNGHHAGWASAVADARAVLRDGAALDLVNRMRTARATNLLTVGHG